MDSSSLIEAVRRRLGGGGRALAARLTDRRGRRGIRHELAPVVSVPVAGAACGHRGALAIAEAAAGRDQKLLAARGCRVSPRAGLRVAPSARTLYRVPGGLDAGELEAALTATLADAALDPQVTAAAAAKRQEEPGKKDKKRKQKPPAAGSFRQEREDRLARTRCTRGRIPRPAGIRGTSRPGTPWPWTARSARALRPAGRRKSACSPPSPAPPAS